MVGKRRVVLRKLGAIHQVPIGDGAVVGVAPPIVGRRARHREDGGIAHARRPGLIEEALDAEVVHRALEVERERVLGARGLHGGLDHAVNDPFSLGGRGGC